MSTLIPLHERQAVENQQLRRALWMIQGESFLAGLESDRDPMEACRRINGLAREGLALAARECL